LNNPLVEFQDVCKTYDTIQAVDHLSFVAYAGEIFGLLGPNGAGKTTSLEMIEGLREPDSGRITVEGYDVLKTPRAVKERIGVQLQSTSLYNKIRVDEALKLYGGYYKKRRSVDELLELVSLQDKRRAFHKDLSGGQQQRLALALALVNDPAVVFLDEPTTGLDPQARRNLWDIISRMKADGKTVILTTHYMDEAERLCDRVLIIDHGRKIAEGAPSELISRLNVASCLEFEGDGSLDKGIFQQLPAVSKVVEMNGKWEIFSKTPQKTLIELINLSEQRRLDLQNLTVRQATLEDLFIELTGRSLRE